MTEKNTVTEVTEATKEVLFADLGLNDQILSTITKAGYTHPSPIQAAAIPIILAGHDLIGQAQTGTGKTAAFALPCLEQMDPNDGIQMLVITPTRELTMQVATEVERFGNDMRLKVATIYGGTSYTKQYSDLRRANAVIATPGRMLDLLKGGKIQNFNPFLVVLDEADEMLDMGFLEDIQAIFDYLPEDRQTLMFSATMPDQIRRLAAKILKAPKHVSVISKETKGHADIEQRYYVIEPEERTEALVRLIETWLPTRAVVFCRTKRDVDEVAETLNARGASARGLHGDMAQKQREDTIQSFRNGTLNVLVATDVAARGLDIKDLSHVFNYHIPFDPDSYVHRIGRTGRAGNKGMAVTLVTPFEFRDLKRITDIVGQLTVGYIPNRDGLREMAIERAMQKAVEEDQLHKGAVDLSNLIQTMMTAEDGLIKLASLMLKAERVSGPDRIGFDELGLEALMARMGKRGKSHGPSSGGRSSHGGGYRGGHGGGGGGGYRGNRGSEGGGGGYRGGHGGGAPRGEGGGGYNRGRESHGDTRPARHDSAPQRSHSGERPDSIPDGRPPRRPFSR